MISCTLATGGSSSWCKITLGRTGATGFVAKRYLAFGTDQTIRQEPKEDEIVLRLPDDKGDVREDDGFEIDFGDEPMQDDYSEDELDAPEETSDGQVYCPPRSNLPICN